MGTTPQSVHFQLDHVELSILGNFIPHDDLLLHGASDDFAEDSSINSTNFLAELLRDLGIIFSKNLGNLLLKGVVVFLALLQFTLEFIVIFLNLFIFNLEFRIMVQKHFYQLFGERQF